MGAFFTATSMIGFMAGAGIVVRNSIILVDFIEQGLLCSDSVGGPLSISFSSKTVGYFFPRLYPEGVEI
jgi:hypothetical protein